jgi:hypothetical protein
VIHLVVEHVEDLSAELKRISGLDGPFPDAATKRAMAGVGWIAASQSPLPARVTCMSPTCTSTRSSARRGISVDNDADSTTSLQPMVGTNHCLL